MAEHTPGPWIFEPHGAFRSDMLGEDWPVGYISVRPGDVLFAMGEVFDGRPIDEVKANARLIAAAPDLLEALEALLMATEEIGYVHYGPLRKAARAAIEKARTPEAHSREEG